MTEQESTAIIVRPSVLPSTAQFQMMRELAERLSYAEGFLPDHFFKGDPATRKHRILAAIEYGRAVGIEPMIALQNISMINGKAGASALLIGALLRKSGYEPQKPVYSDNDTKCEVTVTKNGKVMSVGKYSIEDARKAGLLRSGGGWEKNPRDMLYARALTQAGRQGAQDAVLGMAYTAEELGVETDEDFQVSGEIAFAKASAESVAALQAEQVNRQAAGATSPPAPSQEVSGERSGTAAASPLPAAIQEPVPAMTQTPPGTAPTRSGPRAKRGNVVAAPVTLGSVSGNSETVASAGSESRQRPLAPPDRASDTSPSPSSAGAKEVMADHRPTDAPRAILTAGAPTGLRLELSPPATALDAPRGSQAADFAATDRYTDLTVEHTLDAPLDGQEQYLDGLRQQAREAAAVIRHLQVKRENLLKTEQVKLGTATAQNLPVLTPNLEADDSLRQFIEKRFPGHKLADLGEAELDGSDDAPGILRALQSIIDALHAKGFHE